MSESAANVIPFLFEGEHLIRVVMRSGMPWFVATDIGRRLGTSNVSQAVSRLDEDERDAIILNDVTGRSQPVFFALGGPMQRPDASPAVN